MKILIVSQYFYPENFRINDVCLTLQELGHDVTVLTGLPNYPSGIIPMEYRGRKRRSEFFGGVKILRSWLVGRKKGTVWLVLNYISFVLCAGWKALFLQRDFDIVLTYQLSPVSLAIPAVLYKLRYKKRMLLYCLDLWPESAVAVTRIKKDSFCYNVLLRLSRWIYSNCDRVAITSEAFKEYLEKVIGYKGPISYLPQYAEDVFSSLEPIGENEGSGEVALLFAGNLGEMQSIETIIKAADLLRDRPEIKWHIVGDGSSRTTYEHLAQNLNLLDSTVYFHGQKPLSEMPAFYAKASALLITLKADSFVSLTLPGKVQSYMAFGKPIIGAVNGEAKRVIEESGAGYCCEAEDFAALADEVRKFADQRESWTSYSERAKLYYASHFSKDKFFDDLLTMLKELSTNV